ncbi:hypothetical protein U1Q18_028977, partial [Sarracenia purpurea var. burkii]
MRLTPNGEEEAAEGYRCRWGLLSLFRRALLRSSTQLSLSHCFWSAQEGRKAAGAAGVCRRRQ